MAREVSLLFRRRWSTEMERQLWRWRRLSRVLIRAFYKTTINCIWKGRKTAAQVADYYYYAWRSGGAAVQSIYVWNYRGYCRINGLIKGWTGERIKQEMEWFCWLARNYKRLFSNGRFRFFLESFQVNKSNDRLVISGKRQETAADDALR